MKKILPILIVIGIVLSGLGAATVTDTAPKSFEKTELLTFSPPDIASKDGYTVVSVENTNSWVYHPDSPLLPTSVVTYRFPFGTKIKNIAVIFSEPQEYPLDQQLQSVQ